MDVIFDASDHGSTTGIIRPVPQAILNTRFLDFPVSVNHTFPSGLVR